MEKLWRSKKSHVFFFLQMYQLITFPILLFGILALEPIVADIRICPQPNFAGTCITRITLDGHCTSNLQFAPFSAAPVAPRNLCTMYTTNSCGGSFVNIGSAGNPSLGGRYISARCVTLDWGLEEYIQCSQIYFCNKFCNSSSVFYCILVANNIRNLN